MDGVGPFADLQAFLDDLRAVGVEVCICSSTRRDLVRQWVDRHALGKHFRVVDGWSLGRDKAEQMRSVLDWSGLAPDRCLVVGDSRRDGQLAASIGMRFRGVLRQETSNLEGSGFAYAPDLRSISRAILIRRRLGVVTLPSSAGREHQDIPPPHTLAPECASSEPRDLERASGIVGHVDATAQAVDLPDPAGQSRRVGKEITVTDH
jgi:hypothetical protein